MNPKIAIIWFPGNNCENETKVACEAAGMSAEIIRWNSKEKLDEYDGFIIPGGWAYEDRIRAGVIPSKDPIMDKIREQSSKGKLILGICNGCQVLIESGLIPGITGKAQMGLAPNINPIVSGFYCTWVRIKNHLKKKNAFNILLGYNEVIEIPIAHAEGRFVTNELNLIEQLEQNDQIIFKYCDINGNVENSFPINPNSSQANIAGLINKEGNIMAMMPHPERAFFKRQLKEKQMNNFEDAMTLTKAAKIFESMREYIIKK